jgi:hypothetical protein
MVRSHHATVTSKPTIPDSSVPTVTRRMVRAAGLLVAWVMWTAVLLASSLGALKEDSCCGGVKLMWWIAILVPLLVGLGVTFAPRGRFAVILATFAISTPICIAAAIMLTLSPDSWPMMGARLFGLCE